MFPFQGDGLENSSKSIGTWMLALENKMTTIYVFVKIVDKIEYAESLMDGKLHMNSVRFFKEYRDKEGHLRGDPYEGIAACYQPERTGEITLGDLTIPSSSLAGPIVAHYDHILDSRAFCLYSVDSRGHDTVSAETLSDFKEALEIHRHNFGFGTHCVVILDGKEFLNRTRKAIRKAGLRHSSHLIEYFDETSFHGIVPENRQGFFKRKKYQLQREFRLLLHSGQQLDEPFMLDVGDLHDIIKLTTPEDFNDELKVTLPDGSSA